MKLHTPKQRGKGKRWYCGPFAFAAITGYSFEDTREVLNWNMGRPHNTGICGIENGTMLKALNAEGFKPSLREDLSYTRETFAQWLKRFDRLKSAVYLLELTSHYVLVQDDWFIDNHSKHKVHISQAPWKRKRVLKVWKITDLNDLPDWR